MIIQWVKQATYYIGAGLSQLYDWGFSVTVETPATVIAQAVTSNAVVTNAISSDGAVSLASTSDGVVTAASASDAIP